MTRTNLEELDDRLEERDGLNGRISIAGKRHCFCTSAPRGLPDGRHDVSSVLRTDE